MMAELDKGRPSEMSVDGFDERRFFDEYLSESRPLVVRRQAQDWNATQKWTSDRYLGDLFSYNLVELKSINRKGFLSFKKLQAKSTKEADSDSDDTDS